MNGIILINKEKEYTSHDVVYKIKKLLNEKVGHTGTLDPMATGVLPLLVGKGTLCSKYLINHDKIYKVKLELGKKTATADIEGKIIEEKEVQKDTFEKDNIEKTFETFIGKQQQIPPIYSAIKVNGKKLYEYARKGQEVKIEPRDIEIYYMKLLNIDEENLQIEFEVSCSKGTYIRSLCEDIAGKLGTVGFMKELQRIKVGEFELKDTVTIKDIEENIENEEFFEKHFISIEKLFKNKDKIELDNKKLEMFLNGVKLKLNGITTNNANDIYRIYNNNKFIGIGVIENNLLKRDIIICF